MDAWMDRGGSVRLLRNDEDLCEWLEAREIRCAEWVIEPEKRIAHKPKVQRVHRTKEHWQNTRRAWPSGVGEKMLATLATYLVHELKVKPSLSNALALATSSRVVKVKGWGEKAFVSCQGWIGQTDLVSEDSNLYQLERHVLGTFGEPNLFPAGRPLKGL